MAQSLPRFRERGASDARGCTAPDIVRVRLGGTVGRAAAMVAGVVMLCCLSWWSLFVGSRDVSFTVVVDTLFNAHGAEDEVLIREMRLPRTVNALVVGAALGVAGAVMQSLINNPLADPGLLGVNAGAGLAVVLAVGVIGIVGFERYIGFALGGALIISLIIYGVAMSVGRGSPFTIVLTGVAVTAVLTGITTGLAVLDPARFNALRGWTSGSVANVPLPTIGKGAVLIGLGFLLSALTARPLSQLSLGEDTARSLGVNLITTRLTAGLAITVLAGGATALGGPITFIGLMVPHFSRLFAGPRLGWSMGYAALAGAALLVAADMLGRIVLPDGEAPAGLITAIIGAPALALLARRGAGGRR